MTSERREPADLHQPVMLREILHVFEAAPAGLFVDATVGLGGHADSLLEARQDIRLAGLDRDADALELADLRLARHADRYELSQADYRALPEIAERRGWQPTAVLVDMGVSSLQLDSAERGFSFRHEGPLDMRMDRRGSRTAADLVNRLEYSELRALIRDHGEDPHASRIARAIVRARANAPILTTTELADVIRSALPQRGPQRIHPATRTFQGLRIAVNDELAGLHEFVIGTARLLSPGGRLAVLAFHSLEDRAVKRAFRYLASNVEGPEHAPELRRDRQPEARLVSRRPMRPSEDEIARNPRARSARLRVLERI